MALRIQKERQDSGLIPSLREYVRGYQLNARRLAKFLPPESRAWTLEPPPWRSRPESVDEYLVRTGRADRLWRT